MVPPKVVRPRVICPGSGETVPLEGVVESLLRRSAPGEIALVGPFGSGKSTALAYLAGVMTERSEVTLVDDSDGSEPPPGFRARLVVRAYCKLPTGDRGDVYRLAPWTIDDAMEYLLAAHHQRCASVMARLRRATDLEPLGGIAEMWGVVLDQMAEDESVVGAQSALRRFLDVHLADPAARALARGYSLPALKGSESIPSKYAQRLQQLQCSATVLRALRHRPVQLLLAAERIAGDLSSGEKCFYLAGRLPRDLVDETAKTIFENRQALDHLAAFVAGGDRNLHAMAASILHATRTGWIPPGNRVLRLHGAYLKGASWRRIDLRGAQLDRADLANADLSGANLDNATADRTCFSHSTLCGASLAGFSACEADLSGANLTSVRAQNAHFYHAGMDDADLRRAVLCGATFIGASLKNAHFAEADLSEAILTDALIEGADFRRANLQRSRLSGLRLSGAKFQRADFAAAEMCGCDLEYMMLPAADFRTANLENAVLTGSTMAHANFRSATLRGAGLADINWEHAVLCEADLCGATFHMGSSRSGLVMSPYASEGSRTGFYTDDYGEQHYKLPEEVRKANLCGADLRGALVAETDFYLVDLRGAVFSQEQAVHFRRCGAILGDWAG